MADDATTTRYLHRIHSLLNQSHSAATNLVTDAMILDYLTEGVEVACNLAKIYQKSTTLTTLGHDKATITISADLETSALTVSDAFLIDILNIYGADNVALTRMAPNDRGRLFYGAETLSTSDYPLYYYDLGDTVYLLPAFPTTGADHWTATVEWAAKPKGSVVLDNTTTASCACANTTDRITFTTPTLVNGTPCYLTAAVIPTGLTAYVTYYLRYYAANVYTLHTTEAGALANTAQALFTTDGTTVVVNGLVAAPDYSIGTAGCPIDAKHWPTLTNFALYRGKQAYNAFNEASGYLSAFAQGLGIEIQDLKQKLGETK